MDEDGTVDISGASMHIFSRGESREEIESEELMRFFLNAAEQHTRSFNDEGHHWPSMREARPLWFK